MATIQNIIDSYGTNFGLLDPLVQQEIVKAYQPEGGWVSPAYWGDPNPDVGPIGGLYGSGIFGGKVGPIDQALARPKSSFSPYGDVGKYSSVGYGYGPNASDTAAAIAKWEENQAKFAPHLKNLTDIGYMQVYDRRPGDQLLSIGAEEGYRDPSKISWHPDYGLITPTSNFIYPKPKRDFGYYMNQAIPAAIIALGTGGAGSAIGAGIGGATGAAAGGALGGAAGGAMNAAIRGQDIGKGILTGAIGGGLGGLAGPLSSMGAQQLIEAGMNPTLAGALASGVTRAGTGAIGAGLLGGDVGQAALSGLVSGAAGGVNPALGTLAKLGMGLANRPQAPARAVMPTARRQTASPVSRGPLGTLASGAGGLLPSQAQGRRGTGSGGMAGLTGLGLRGLY